jgi:hypothetical protein
MHNRTVLNTVLIVIVCSFLLLMPVLVSAESAVDETATHEAAETDEGPAGVGVLMLLLGIGSVAVVGGAMIGRDAFKGHEAAA